MAVVGRATVTIELADGGWALQPIDVIAFEGGYWLVPLWTLSADGLSRQPVRLVTLTMADNGEPASDPEAFCRLPHPCHGFSPMVTCRSAAPGCSWCARAPTCGCRRANKARLGKLSLTCQCKAFMPIAGE